MEKYSTISLNKKKKQVKTSHDPIFIVKNVFKRDWKEVIKMSSLLLPRCWDYRRFKYLFDFASLYFISFL